MRFWTPKVRTEERDWSVVLNPLKSELDKRRIAGKISELFHLSFEEARELVQNTPLVLLEGLSHPLAVQVQNIFQGIRADVALTSDASLKRRCFRAVWSDRPNLSFLEKVPAVGRDQEKLQEAMPVKKADEKVSETEERTVVLSDSLRDLQKRHAELESRYLERTREMETLKLDFEKASHEAPEKNATELQTRLRDWEERYESLKEEYRETQSIYEEKILLREREFESLASQLRERMRDLELWQGKAVALERQIEEYQKGQALDEERRVAQDRESGEKIARHEKELKALQGQIKELLLWQEKAHQLEKQNKSFLERLDQLESANRGLERSLKEQSEAVNLWREKYQNLVQRSDRFEALYGEEKKRREETEESQRQISDLAERTRMDIEAQVAETERWRKKFQELEANQKHIEEEFAQLSAEQASECKQLRESNRTLETQLDSAQRQARDLLFRVETQELIEKRARLANELASREAQLRELALESDRLRQEIQDRELRAQALGNEQASLEREILEVKQTQRHLLEQSKLREKNHKFKKASKSLSESELGIDNG